MKKRKGFTLIELLVTITIIGILAVGGIGVFSEQMKKARDSNRVKDIKTLASGIEQYTLDNGHHYNTNLANTTADLERKTFVDDFRNAHRNYVPNIDSIYDKKHGKRDCAYNSGSFLTCLYAYRSGTEGYKIMTRFESKSNICLNLEQCFATQDGGLFGNEFEIWTQRGLDIINIRVVNQGINLPKPTL